MTTSTAKTTKTVRTTSRQRVQAAETGAEILKALARTGPASLSRLSEAAGMAPAKAHRYLQAMIVSGLAAQDRYSGHYMLGPDAVAIGLAALASIDVVGGISDMLPDLRDQTGHTCFMSVWGSHGATVIRVIEAIDKVTVVTRTGSIMPPLRSATGLAFVAFLSPSAERDAVIGTEPADLQQQMHDAASPLSQRLELIRRTGISAVEGSIVQGIGAMAVPVFGAQSDPVAVVTAIGPEGNFDPSMDGSLAQTMHAFSRAASLKIGGTRFLHDK